MSSWMPALQRRRWVCRCYCVGLVGLNDVGFTLAGGQVRGAPRADRPSARWRAPAQSPLFSRSMLFLASGD